MRHFFAALVGSALMACSPAGEPGNAGSIDHGIDVMESGMIVTNAWVRKPLPGRDIATAYFHIINSTDQDDRLLAVSTDVNNRTEIHTHLNEDGVMKMRRLEGLELAGGDMAMFEPGGLHIMMFESHIPAGASDVTLTLKFQKHEPLTVVAEIMDMAPVMEMDHSGH